MIDQCIFCKIIKHEIPASFIYENHHVIVIKDINPKAPIHYLIIPKEHTKDIQSLDEKNISVISEEIFSAAQKLSRETPGAEDFKLIINSGYNAGQRVFHLHAHFLAGGKFGEV